MKIVAASGDARAIGRITGESLREEIRHNVALNIRPETDAEWQKRRPAFLAALERRLPLVLEEMRGTAEGADLPLDTIVRLNVPLYPHAIDRDACCTNIAFASGPDGPIWGKNNDNGPADERCQRVAVRVVRRDDAIPNVIFTYAGMLATTDGLNAEGVAVGHSSVGSIFQQSDHHPAIRLWAYECMLHSRGADEFVRRMTAVPTRGKGYSILCVDRAGVTCSIEAACPLMQVRRSADKRGHMNCVNYYQLPHLAEADRRKPDAKPNAIARAQFLERAVTEGDDFSLAGMKALLRHHGDPSICRHGGKDMSYTEYSMIALPRDGRVYFLYGNPCAQEYVELAL